MAKTPKKPTGKKPATKKPAAKKKETSDKLSKLAAQVLAGKTPTAAEAKMLAGSVLSQDVTKGGRGK